MTRKVKNLDLQKLIDQNITDYGGIKSSGQAALSDYISKYLAGAKDSSVRSGQEIGAVDQFYDGKMAGQLSQLRSSRSKAVTDAATRASQYALANLNRSRLNSEGGGSSYDTRILARNVGDIQTQAALDNSNQERADLGYLTGNQLALAGERNKVANAQAGYGLVPEAVRRSMYQQDNALIGNLGQLDQMNKFYGLKQDSNKWADIADSMDQGILNAASIYSSVGGGGMKRGGEVDGPGTGTSDSIHVRLSDGEFVIRAAAVQIPGVKRILEVINLLGEDENPSKKTKSRNTYSRGGLVKFWGGKKKGYEMGGPIGVGNFDMGAGVGMAGPSDWSMGMSPVDTGNMVSSSGDMGFWGSPPGQTQNPNMPQNLPEKPKQKSSGGGGGLSGQAMALQARVDRSTGPGQVIPSDYGVPQMTDDSFMDVWMNSPYGASFWGNQQPQDQ